MNYLSTNPPGLILGPAAVPVTQIGDLWVCGPHRVLCGDATSPDAVARLLGKRKPLLLVTDPPLVAARIMVAARIRAARVSILPREIRK